VSRKKIIAESFMSLVSQQQIDQFHLWSKKAGQKSSHTPRIQAFVSRKLLSL
jgi:hypothetical protein